jgi:hypothetical protein
VRSRSSGLGPTQTKRPPGAQTAVDEVVGDVDVYRNAAKGSQRTGVTLVRIPIQSGQGFRFDVGRRSDLMSATIPK